MICNGTGDEKDPLPDGRRILWAGHPLTTPQTRDTLGKHQPGAEDGKDTPTEVVVNHTENDPVPGGRISAVGAGYPITTPHTP